MSSEEKISETWPFLGNLRHSFKDQSGSGSHHRKQNTTKFLLPLLVFSLTSLLWITVFTLPHVLAHRSSSHHQQNYTSGLRYIDCGSTPDEAISKGCAYDVFMVNWIPAPCHDAYWSAQYQQRGSWHGYADDNLTQLLTIDEMSRSELYFTSPREHIDHCAHIWKKQFDILFERRPAIDTKMASRNHVHHCAWILSMTPEERMVWEKHPTANSASFAGCWVKD